MQIELHLFATLSKYLPKDARKKTCMIDVPDHSIINDLIVEMKLPEKSVKLIFLNGIHADRTAKLKDGDRVGVFPPVGGG